MMSLSRESRRLMVVSATLAVLPTILWYGYEQWHLSGVVAFAASERPAFTVNLTEVVRVGPDREGPGEVSRYITIAQRSDGARSELSVYHPGTEIEYQVREIQNPDFGTVKAWDSIGKKTTLDKPSSHIIEHRILARRTVASDCFLNGAGTPASEPTRGVEKQSIKGLEAVLIINDQTGLEQWIAPQLDCEIVRLFVAFREAGVVTDSSERFITNYKLGEPDSFLFDVSSLEETPPIAAALEQYKASPDDMLQQIEESLRGLERMYNAQARRVPFRSRQGY